VSTWPKSTTCRSSAVRRMSTGTSSSGAGSAGRRARAVHAGRTRRWLPVTSAGRRSPPASNRPARERRRRSHPRSCRCRGHRRCRRGTRRRSRPRRCCPRTRAPAGRTAPVGRSSRPGSPPAQRAGSPALAHHGPQRVGSGSDEIGDVVRADVDVVAVGGPAGGQGVLAEADTVEVPRRPPLVAGRPARRSLTAERGARRLIRYSAGGHNVRDAPTAALPTPEETDS
jgi:hypothetical protein